MELGVQGMTCEGCAEAVRRSVGRAAPQARVEVDLAGGRVIVDGAADRAAVVSAIKTAGFEVTP